MKEVACGNCKYLKLCAYARAMLRVELDVQWRGKSTPFSWYEIAKICKFYEHDENST